MSGQYREALLTQLKRRRRQMAPAIRKRTRFRLPTTSPQYPWMVERAYGKYIARVLEPLIQYTEEYMSQHQASILKGDSLFKMDAVPGAAFDILWATLNGWLAQHFPADSPGAATRPTTVLLGLGGIADATKAFTTKQWNAQMKSKLGFDFPTAEEWWKPMKDRWATENYALIKSLAGDYITKTNKLTEQAITGGWRWEDLQREIKKTGANITDARARLIARDQIGKLNGHITHTQMTEVGLDMYIWRTVGDERVRGRPGGAYKNSRPSHWAMEGLLCRWDDASVYSKDGGKTWIPRPAGAVLMHPGEDIQCRCTGLAYWNELIGEADASLGDQIAS